MIVLAIVVIPLVLLGLVIAIPMLLGSVRGDLAMSVPHEAGVVCDDPTCPICNPDTPDDDRRQAVGQGVRRQGE
jgi:hypothetical protein